MGNQKMVLDWGQRVKEMWWDLQSKVLFLSEVSGRWMRVDCCLGINGVSFTYINGL